MEPLHSKDPTEIGPFQVVAHLGTGGMGRVYLAESEGKTAAIKILSPAGIRSANMRTRFEREIGALKKIQSPFVASIVDSEVEPHELWLAVEYINGPSLAQRVEHGPPLNHDEWLELLVGSLIALTSVHDLGIIHRDIKPANILLSGVGPQLIDFGIAQSPDETSLTTTQGFVGSPAWASPDVFGDDELTNKTDIFSLGSTLVYALTGQSPWGSTTTRAGQVMKRLMEQQPDLADVPGQYRLLLAKMLQKSPDSRPNARECLALAIDLAKGPALDKVAAWVELRRSQGRSIPEDVAEVLDLEARANTARAVEQANRQAEAILVAAERNAERVVADHLTRAQAEATRITENAKRDAEAALTGATQRAKQQLGEAQATLDKARAEAAATLDEARKEAALQDTTGTTDNAEFDGGEAGQTAAPTPRLSDRRILTVLIVGVLVTALVTSGLWWLFASGSGQSLLSVATPGGDQSAVGTDGDASESGSTQSGTLIPECQGLLCDVAFRVSTAGSDALVITGWSKGTVMRPDEPLAVEFLDETGQLQSVGSCGTAIEVPFLTGFDFHGVWSVECSNVEGLDSWPQKYPGSQQATQSVHLLRAGPDHSNRYTNEWGQAEFVLDESINLVRDPMVTWPELTTVIFPFSQYGQQTPEKLFPRSHLVLSEDGLGVFWVDGDLGGRSPESLFNEAYQFVPEQNALIRQDCVPGSLDATGERGWNRVDGWESLDEGNLWAGGRWGRISIAQWSSNCPAGQVERTYTLNLGDVELSDACARVRFTNTATETASDQSDSAEQWCLAETTNVDNGEATTATGNEISPDTIELSITPHQWLNANIVNLSMPQPPGNPVAKAVLLLTDAQGEPIDLVATNRNEPVPACAYGFDVDRQGSARQDRVFFQQRCGPPLLRGGSAVVVVTFDDGSSQRHAVEF